MLWAVHPSQRGLILYSDNGIFSSPKCPDRLWDISQEKKKWSERKVTYSRPALSEVKNEKDCIFASPQVCMAFTGAILTHSLP